jgi:tRNA(Ile)-lysidine synthase
MQMSLSQRVLRAIEAQRMFRAGDRVGVGVSGGADSVALLLLLENLRERLGIGLAVLHFNHQLRGAESDADEQFVAALAAEHGIDFLAGRGDVAGEARARGWNLEDAARRMRYEFFSAAVRDGRATHVSVAHTADDQAETVLARLVRGTGPAGLAAIYPVKGHVVRPLLEVRRCELREYLEGRGESWREDASNLDTTRLRARLRHQVLPVIERELQPAVVAHLCRLAQMAREDEGFWAALGAERAGALVRREGDRLGIRCADLLAPLQSDGAQAVGTAQIALSKRLVRRIVEELKGDRLRLTSRHVDQVMHLAGEGSSGRRTELPGVVVERSFEWIWFEGAGHERGEENEGTSGSSEPEAGCQNTTSLSETKTVSKTETLSRTKTLGERASLRKTTTFSYAVELQGAGETAVVAVPEISRVFRLKVIDWPAAARDTNVQGFLDRDSLHSPLLLRSWRPGDCYRPQGRRNVHKLKQLLRAGHISVRDRAGWPVLTSAGVLAWSRGFPVAAEFAARKATRSGVVITEEKM